MLTTSLLRSLTAGSKLARLRREHRRIQFKKQAIRRWAVERLEHRALLSTFVVNTVSDLDVASGLPVGQESLRQAIEDANADTSSDVDSIDFNIPGSGVQTIQPLSQLPIVTHPVVIDGYSQPGSKPNDLAACDDAVLLIELDGSSAGGAFGLGISCGGSKVMGLDINSFESYGIYLTGAGGNVIEGNFIGTDPTGELPLETL
jgi:large repetitive protein